MNAVIKSSDRSSLKPVIVVGAGLSGKAAAKLLHQRGYAVRVLDKKPLKSDTDDFAVWAAGADVEIRVGEHRREDFCDAAFVVPSPGVAVSTLREFTPEGTEFIAETELAFRELNTEKVLAITGTSGKTTTTSLCGAMLREQGLRVFVGGNIGTPLSTYVLNKLEHQNGQRLNPAAQADVVVLELSSFQLQTCSTFRPDVGVLLNISPNHLDYHADMNEYIAAKMGLFAQQTPDAVALFGEGLDELTAGYSVRAQRRIFRPCGRFTDMQLFGAHNQANAEAAFQACSVFGVNEKTAQRAVAAFLPIEHRLERVLERRGVLFVNDSKCTTVEALRVALQAFERPVLLLAGGKFKGGDLTALLPLMREKVRHLALYGANRTVFEQAFAEISLSWDETLEAAMIRLAGPDGMARENDVVLLAPATSSYDQYRDYIARGNDFKRVALEVLA